MTLPLRWRIACAVTSLLAVAALATPAGGAPIVTTVTLNDVMGDTRPFAQFGQADVLTSTAAYKPAEITFTLKTGIPEDPADLARLGSASTGIDFLDPDEGRRARPRLRPALRRGRRQHLRQGLRRHRPRPGQPAVSTPDGHLLRQDVPRRDRPRLHRPAGVASPTATSMTYNADAGVVTDALDNGDFSAAADPGQGRLLDGRPRRRHLRLRRRAVLRFDRRHAAQPADRRHGLRP